jgi:hypothetical protein
MGKCCGLTVARDDAETTSLAKWNPRRFYNLFEWYLGEGETEIGMLAKHRNK